MFENQIKQIVDNFLTYLQQSYDKLFSERVLQNLNLSDENNDQSTLNKSDDFNQTLQSMTQSRFVLDVSFLGLLVKGFKQHWEERKDVTSEQREEENVHWDKINLEINNVFNQIKSRNFKQCEVNDKYYIYSCNQDDFKIDLTSSDNNNESVSDSNNKIYNKNLLGGIDAFEENELRELFPNEK